MTKEYYRSALFNELERPLDSYYQLDATIGDDQSVRGNIVLTRPRQSAPFGDADVQNIKHMLTFFAYAMAAQARDFDTSNAQERRQGVLVYDLNQQLQFADATARHLLWMMANPDIRRTSYEEKLTSLADFAQSLVVRLMSIERGEPAAPPARTVNNGWGRFRARADWLDGLRGERRYIRVLLGQYEPSTITLQRNLYRFGLTPRQQQVCRLLLEGNSQIEIGKLMGLKHWTVNEYAQESYRKLGVHDRQGLVQILQAREF